MSKESKSSAYNTLSIDCGCGYSWRGKTMTHKKLIWKCHAKKCKLMRNAKMQNTTYGEIAQHTNAQSGVFSTEGYTAITQHHTKNGGQGQMPKYGYGHGQQDEFRIKN
tara:strand:+ start:1146 stop:1469 length:324 start_codon:yes stop_codon:yes gene_type:complete